MSYATKEQLESLVSDIASKVNIPVVEGGGGFAPIGMIGGFMGLVAPQGWLACNGQTYDIADYEELTDFFESHFGSKNYFGGDGTTTFAVPDLQGEFLRGTGTNSHTNQGNGANVGEHQDGTNHVSAVSNGTNAILVGDYFYNMDTRLPDSVLQHGMIRNAAATNKAATDNGHAFTSRPTNTSVLWCIKAKNNEPSEYVAGEGIDITDGEISINEMSAEDMAEVASPMPSVMSRRFKYSTEEQVVGEWIDGKPLYQKTYSYKSDGSSLVPTGISNLGIIVAWECSFGQPNNDNSWWNFLNEQVAYGNGGIVYNQSNNTIGMKFKDSSWGANRTVIITIRYTKTTD